MQPQNTQPHLKKQTKQTNSKPFYKHWWFWALISGGVLIVAGAVVVMIIFLQHDNLSTTDEQMMKQYYPEFVLSTNSTIRGCQLGKLRDGLRFVKGYNDSGDNNSARSHYETLAEQCGNGPADGGVTALKPILYLYPTKTSDVTVTLQNPQWIDVSYPKYTANGWSVNVSPDGNMTDSAGMKYYALYWDETHATSVDFSTGFYVDKDSAAKFLEDKLTQIGLNDKERNECIMYWLPKLEHNGKSLVYFELTDELQQHNALHITPAPDSLLRVRLHIKKVDAPVTITPQHISRFERYGFTAVEWGGVER